MRPDGIHAKQVSCVPYDVVYESEVRKFIENNPLSFLRVTRAEAEFPEGANPPIKAVFARARQNLEWFINEHIYENDGEDAFYVYQLASDDHTQTGVVGCCSLDEYEAGVIKNTKMCGPTRSRTAPAICWPSRRRRD